MLVEEALLCTNVEKPNALERYADPGKEEAESCPLIVCCFHVPFPVVLVFEGVNRHSSDAAVEHEPVYADISPAADIDGQKVLDSSWRNGKSDVKI